MIDERATEQRVLELAEALAERRRVESALSELHVGLAPCEGPIPEPVMRNLCAQAHAYARARYRIADLIEALMP